MHARPKHGAGDAVEPTIGWHKGYVSGSRPDLRVPMREVQLTNGRT